MGCQFSSAPLCSRVLFRCAFGETLEYKKSTKQGEAVAESRDIFKMSLFLGLANVGRVQAA